MLKRTCLCALLLSAVAFGGCGSPATPDSSTTFQGTIAGSGGQTGTLNITIQAVVVASSAGSSSQPGGLFAGIKRTWSAFAPVVLAAASSASGTVHLAGGSTTSLSGTYDSLSKAVSLSGGGFTFTGTTSGGGLSGTYVGPNNSSGNFSGLNSTSAPVTTYCGTGSNGLGFNMEISATGTVSGETSDGSCGISGQLSGNTLTFSCRGTTATGTGTVQNGTVSGTTTTENGHHDTFTGSTSACQ